MSSILFLDTVRTQAHEDRGTFFVGYKYLVVLLTDLLSLSIVGAVGNRNQVKGVFLWCALKSLRLELRTFCEPNEMLVNIELQVNVELTRRIRETMEARNKIQHHLGGTLQEIFNTEQNIEFLKKSISDKINPLKVREIIFPTP